jgi:7,8-dihydro-6-hydroxymethylpterin-pyrophosphokinase
VNHPIADDIIKTVSCSSIIIDMNILFHSEEVVIQNDLEIPHPRTQERSFVLIPFVEIEQDHVHPLQQKTALKLLSATKATSLKSQILRNWSAYIC